jgi:hypothetical protein
LIDSKNLRTLSLGGKLLLFSSTACFEFLLPAVLSSGLNNLAVITGLHCFQHVESLGAQAQVVDPIVVGVAIPVMNHPPGRDQEPHRLLENGSVHVLVDGSLLAFESQVYRPIPRVFISVSMVLLDALGLKNSASDISSDVFVKFALLHPFVFLNRSNFKSRQRRSGSDELFSTQLFFQKRLDDAARAHTRLAKT